MLEQIKGLMRIKEELDEMSKKFEESSSSAKSFQLEISLLKKELDELKSSQSIISTQFKSDTQSVREVKEELKKEIGDFKLVKSRLEQKLVEKFEEELKNELSPRLERMDKFLRHFEEIEGKIDAISKRAFALTSEIQKLSEISQNIKKEDFELTRFANQLKAMDSEKLELMRKIDMLERLVGKLRRSSQ
jgi:uncharacterized coiled-coil DUF342 family protein